MIKAHPKMEGGTAAAHGATQAAKLFGSATGNALTSVFLTLLSKQLKNYPPDSATSHHHLYWARQDHG